MSGGGLSFEGLVVAAKNFARMKGLQSLTIWYVENMQIRSLDLLKSKNLSCEIRNAFLSLLNLGLNSMILGLVDT